MKSFHNKTHSNAVLQNLPSDQQTLLTDWLLAGESYRAVQKRLLDDFQISASISGLGRFFQAVCVPLLAEKRAQDQTASQQLTPGPDGPRDGFIQPAMEAMQQYVFALACTPELRTRELKAFFPLLLRMRDQQLQQEKIELKRQVIRAELEKSSASAAANPPLRLLTDEENLFLISQVDKIMGI